MYKSRLRRLEERVEALEKRPAQQPIKIEVIEDGSDKQYVMADPLSKYYYEETLKILARGDAYRKNLINHFLEQYRKKNVQMENPQ